MSIGSHPSVPLFLELHNNLLSNFRIITSFGYLKARSIISFNLTIAFSGALSFLCTYVNLQFDLPSPSCATTIYFNAN